VERERVRDTERRAVSSRFEGIRKQWFDTIAELKKVTWPDQQTTKNLTLVVIAISAVLGALLGGLDWVLQQLFALI
jgi:preprotein translocase subunit SecE